MSFFGPSVRNGLPIGLGSIAGFGVQQFSPADLFAAGEQGFWYDPSDLTTLFQDSAGTTPVTAVEQAVGRMLDKSGRGNHAFQTTSAKRPVLRARYNLLTYSEQFDNGAWGKQLVTVTQNTAVAPDGTTTADTLTESSGSGYHSVYNNPAIIVITGTQLTLSCYAKANTWNFVQINLGGVGATTRWIQCVADLALGTITQSSAGAGGTLTSATISNVGSGWYRIVLTGSISVDASLYSYIGTSPSGTPSLGSYGLASWAGNTSNTVFLWGADLRPTSQATGLIGPTYQRIAAATDYDTTGFLPYLQFDGVDDAMTTNSIDPGAVDKVQVFAGVRKLSDAAVGQLVELSTSVASNNGSFSMPAATAAGQWASFLQGSSTLVNATASGYAAPITTVNTAIQDISLSSNEVVLRINGTQAATSGASDAGTGNYGNYPLFIGARNQTSLYFNGWLSSLIGRFGPTLSSGQISATEAWVNTRTGAY